jgi:FkbM family methyltransferase
MTVLDIGAHVGYYTLLMAKRVGPSGRVFSFEPNAGVRKFLDENIRLNGHAQVTVCPVALFSFEGEGQLEGRDNLNSFLTPGAASMQTSVPMVVFDRYAEAHGIGAIDFIKMDVEGAEYDILSGMRRLLQRYHPILIIELHPLGLPRFGHSLAETWALLEGFGYTVQTIWSQTGTITVQCIPHALLGKPSSE